jgi:hypothetical protein
MEDDYTPPPGMDGLIRALGRKKREDAEWEAHLEEQRLRFENAAADRRQFLTHCQPATLMEYTAWMIGYLQRGGEPSHVYDYPFARAQADWWVLAETPGTEFPPLYGAQSLHLIVPSAGVQFEPAELGHSTVYFMDGFGLVGDLVPVYSDMLPVLAG